MHIFVFVCFSAPFPENLRFWDYAWPMSLTCLCFLLVRAHFLNLFVFVQLFSSHFLHTFVVINDQGQVLAHILFERFFYIPLPEHIRFVFSCSTQVFKGITYFRLGPGPDHPGYHHGGEVREKRVWEG